MLRLIIPSLLAAIVTLLSACSSEQDMPPPKSVISEDNVFKGQVDAIQKAQGVEATIQGNFDQQRDIIDSQ